MGFSAEHDPPSQLIITHSRLDLRSNLFDLAPSLLTFSAGALRLTSPQAAQPQDAQDPQVAQDFSNWRDLLRGEGPALVYLSLIAALILFSYALARGPSESLFLATYGAAAHTLLPGLWIEVGLSVICVVIIYNALLRYLSLTTMFQLATAMTALSLLTLLGTSIGGADTTYAIGGVELPAGNTTLVRIWSDLYIVVLVETYWSLANLHFPLKKAKLVYGFLCAAGTLGSMAGNALVASKLLSVEEMIWSVIPVMLGMSLIIALLSRLWSVQGYGEQSREPREVSSDPPAQPQSKSASGLLKSFKILASSRYLIWILLIVLLSQVSVTLIDYEYKRWLELTYKTKDEISAFQGWVYLVIDIGALSTQLLTGLILVKLGVHRTLLFIPILLLALTGVMFALPSMLLIAGARSVAKFLSYSLFKSAKELLYVPLTYEEKTQGKALIDIMIYRQAKIFASVLLLPSVGLITLGAGPLALGVMIAWVVVTLKLMSVSRDSIT